MKMNKAYLNWSSGKDAALALYYAKEQNDFRVEKLLTTVNKDAERVTMHGVRNELLYKQAESLGLPIQILELGPETGMEEYNRTMREATASLLAEGYRRSVFGDIFLEDLKNYREEQLKSVGIKGAFPLWKRDTTKLLREFIDLGFKAIVVCTNSKYLDDSFCGRLIDHTFIEDLPGNVDPCGENGEYHTFVFDGPIFSSQVNFEVGEKVTRSYQPEKDDNCFQDDLNAWDTEFCFCDLIPK